MVAPVSLIVSAFARSRTCAAHLTPQLRRVDEAGDTVLIAIDLGRGKHRLGGSILAQVTQQIGDVTPDLDDPEDLKRFFAAIQDLNRQDKLLAYHDRSDGGLWATVCEMAFAGHVGVSLNVDMLTLDPNHESDLRRRQGLGQNKLVAVATTARSARCSPKNSARWFRCARRIAIRCWRCCANMVCPRARTSSAS